MNAVACRSANDAGPRLTSAGDINGAGRRDACTTTDSGHDQAAPRPDRVPIELLKRVSQVRILPRAHD
jgi:hypothetical protein